MARIFADGGAQALASASQTLLDFDSYSVAFWLNRTATPAAQRNLIGIGTTTGWSIELTTGNLVSAVLVYSGATDKVRNSTTVPTLNTWMHVVVTHNLTGLLSTDFTFYFNGKSEAGANVSSGVTARVHGAAPLTIGSGIGLLAPPAQIGGPVVIWSRAISASEALALATGAHPIRFKEGLCAIYDLNTAHGEEDWVSSLYLVQGATNPTSAAVNQPLEPVPTSLFPARQNSRTRRSRYFVPASVSFVSDEGDSYQPWSPTRDDGTVAVFS